MNIEGKEKDTHKVGLDLQDLKVRKELHLQTQGKKELKPQAFYSLTTEEKRQFLNWVKSVKFPDGYSVNISKNVSDDCNKFLGLKTHDFHILLQRLFPVGIQPFLRKN